MRVFLSKVYEYILVHTDDMLVVALTAKPILENIDKYFWIKPESVTRPEIFGFELWLVQINEGVTAWTQSSSIYVKEAIKIVDKWLKNHDVKLPLYKSTELYNVS